MIHGYIQKEGVKFSGIDMHRVALYASSLDEYNEVQVGSTRYHFKGYRTSILSWLVDNGHKRICVSPSPSSQFKSATINVRIEQLGPGGTKALTNYVQAGFAKSLLGTNVLETSINGAKGAVGTGRSMLGAAFDGNEIAERAGIVDGSRNNVAAAHASKFAQVVDKALNNRVNVIVGCHFNSGPTTAAKVIDTKLDEITLSALADVVIGA